MSCRETEEETSVRCEAKEKETTRVSEGDERIDCRVKWKRDEREREREIGGRSESAAPVEAVRGRDGAGRVIVESTSPREEVQVAAEEHLAPRFALNVAKHV